MNSKNLFRNLAAFTALLAVAGSMSSPALAQDKKPGVKTTKKTSAKMYECTHCKIKMTAADGKKHNFKCDCGMKLTAVKSAKKKKG